MKTFKTAVIGCGMISKNHFKALKNVENADCVVACDIRPERAAAAAEAYGIPHTETEYHRVLDNPEIDVVHICLPHYLHAQVVIEAMEHGKHVLCEKPMALDPADAEKMIEVRDRTGRTLGICFQNRYNDSSRYMRSLMDSGRMGKVLGARGAVFWNRNPEYYTESDWRGTLDKEGGSALENQAIHTFDLMQWLTVPIKTVEASCSTKAYGCRHYAVLRGQPLELLVQRHAVPARKDAVSPAADPAPDPYPERHGRYDRRRRLPDKRNDTVRDCCGCYTAHPLYLSVRSEVLCQGCYDRRHQGLICTVKRRNYHARTL